MLIRVNVCNLSIAQSLCLLLLLLSRKIAFTFETFLIFLTVSCLWKVWFLLLFWALFYIFFHLVLRQKLYCAVSLQFALIRPSLNRFRKYVVFSFLCRRLMLWSHVGHLFMRFTRISSNLVADIHDVALAYLFCLFLIVLRWLGVKVTALLHGQCKWFFPV